MDRSRNARVIHKRSVLFLFISSARSERSISMNNPFPTSPRRASKSWHSLWQKKHAESAPDSASVGPSSKPTPLDHFLEPVNRQTRPEARAQRTAARHEHLRTVTPP